VPLIDGAVVAERHVPQLRVGALQPAPGRGLERRLTAVGVGGREGAGCGGCRGDLGAGQGGGGWGLGGGGRVLRGIGHHLDAGGALHLGGHDAVHVLALAVWLDVHIAGAGWEGLQQVAALLLGACSLGIGDGGGGGAQAAAAEERVCLSVGGCCAGGGDQEQAAGGEEHQGRRRR